MTAGSAKHDDTMVSGTTACSLNMAMNNGWTPHLAFGSKLILATGRCRNFASYVTMLRCWSRGFAQCPLASEWALCCVHTAKMTPGCYCPFTITIDESPLTSPPLWQRWQTAFWEVLRPIITHIPAVVQYDMHEDILLFTVSTLNRQGCVGTVVVHIFWKFWIKRCLIRSLEETQETKGQLAPITQIPLMASQQHNPKTVERDDFRTLFCGVFGVAIRS